MNVELIEKAAQIVGDNQLLVNIVSKRVQQLNRGADPFVPTTPETGTGDIALMEIIEGKIVWREATEEAEVSVGADPDGMYETLFGDGAAEMPVEDDRVIVADLNI